MTHDIAIEAKALLFYYSTPRKTPWIRGFPVKRVILEKKVALNSIDFTARRGRITALLGRNGSGKTSLIRIITGARLPQRGTIRVFGAPPALVRDRIGLCLGSTLIYYRLTGRENLEYFGNLYSVPDIDGRINELGELLGLTSELDQIVESYSFGMKTKLAFARSLIHRPELLILDEPTLGIDLELATQLRQFIRTLKCTVLFTTHYMEEAEIMANDICFIDEGNIVASGTKEAILNRYGAKNVPEAFTNALGSHEPLSIAS